MTYVVSDGEQTVAFVGDTLFMPDYGTARCDFPRRRRPYALPVNQTRC